MNEEVAMRFYTSTNAGTIEPTDLPMIDKDSSVKDSDSEWQNANVKIRRVYNKTFTTINTL